MRKGGGKNRDSERWVFDCSEVRVIRSHMYLGVDLVPPLKWNAFLERSVNDAKMDVSMVWDI